MSRCFPYAPPAHRRDGARGEAVSEPFKIKLRKEKVKEDEYVIAGQGKEKDKRREKKERRKERKAKKGEVGCVQDNKKRKEVAESSGVSEEHGEPVYTQQSLCYLSDGSRSDKKRKLDQSEASNVGVGGKSSGNVFRIRLKPKEPNVSIDGSACSDFVQQNERKHRQPDPPISGSARVPRQSEITNAVSGSASLSGSASISGQCEITNIVSESASISWSARVPRQNEITNVRSASGCISGSVKVPRQNEITNVGSASASFNGSAKGSRRNEIPGVGSAGASVRSSSKVTRQNEMPGVGSAGGSLRSSSKVTLQNEITAAVSASASISGSARVPQQNDITCAAEKASCSFSERKETSASARVTKPKVPAVESPYKVLIEDWNWTASASQFERKDIDDQDDDQAWLFGTKDKATNKSVNACHDDVLSSLSSNLWPGASYLPHANVYALPYTIPF